MSDQGHDFELGRNLLAARKNVRLTQQQVADQTGHPVTSISDWERGARRPNIDALRAMAEAYGITLDTLVNGTDSDSTKANAEMDTIRLDLRVANALITHAESMLQTESADAAPQAVVLLKTARLVLAKI